MHRKNVGRLHYRSPIPCSPGTIHNSCSCLRDGGQRNQHRVRLSAGQTTDTFEWNDTGTQRFLRLYGIRSAADRIQLRHNRRKSGQTIANVFAKCRCLQESVHLPVEPQRFRLSHAPFRRWTLEHAEFPAGRHRASIVAIPQHQSCQ